MQSPSSCCHAAPTLDGTAPLRCTLPGARGESWPISGSVFGALTKNRSSLDPSLGFAADYRQAAHENGGTFAVDFADGRDRHNIYVRPDAPQRRAYTASHPAALNRSANICTRTAVSIARPPNDGLAKAGSIEAKSLSWHSDPERGLESGTWTLLDSEFLLRVLHLLPHYAPLCTKLLREEIAFFCVEGFCELLDVLTHLNRHVNEWNKY